MSTFDDRADKVLEPLRNNKISNSLFGFASKVGDFSIIWHVIAWTRAIGSRDRINEALALSAALGVESLIVNQGVKRLFKRERPTASGDHRFEVRTPSTSSFPSGHASSAAFAVCLLTAYTGFPLALVWIALGIVVALSRVVVRIHHMSDIVGGIFTGLCLGLFIPYIFQLIFA